MRETIKNVAGIADKAFRVAGFAANAVLLVTLVWGLFWLKRHAIDAYAEIGPLPQLTLSAVEAWVREPELAQRCVAVGKLWVIAVSAVGTAWMTALGLRWAYHAMLAGLNRLKWL